MKKNVFVLLLGIICFVSCNNKTAENKVNEGEIASCCSVKVDSTKACTGDELKIVAIVKIKPECVSEAIPVFKTLVDGSQKEEGNISYNIHRDIADSTKFVVLEAWKSQDAIDYHNNTEHFKAFVDATKSMADDMDITVMKLFY